MEFPDKTAEYRKVLAGLANAHQNKFTIVNAQYVISLMHLNIAVSRALINRRDGKFKANCLGNEIVYHCSPNHSIQTTLETYGIKNCQGAFFALFVDMDE